METIIESKLAAGHKYFLNREGRVVMVGSRQNHFPDRFNTYHDFDPNLEDERLSRNSIVTILKWGCKSGSVERGEDLMSPLENFTDKNWKDLMSVKATLAEMRTMLKTVSRLNSLYEENRDLNILQPDMLNVIPLSIDEWKCSIRENIKGWEEKLAELRNAAATNG